MLEFIGSSLSFPGALELVGEGYGSLGIALLSLTAGQAIVLVVLVGLQSRARTLAVVFYCRSGLFDLVTVDISGVVISVTLVG